MHNFSFAGFRRRILVEALVFILLFLLLMTGRWAGFFESLELAAYDWSLRWRLQETQPKDKTLLILADEEDLNGLGWPLSDAVVADVLEAALAASPRVVGLDLYREQPRPPGHERLVKILREESRIIAVYKFASTKKLMVPPPPALEGQGRTGFVDWLVDGDGVVRQGLLYLGRDGSSHISFSLRLALEYLDKEGVGARPDSVHPRHLRFGRSVIPPMSPQAGGYVGNNPGGYRFLLDFNGGESPFITYSFTDLLQGRVPAKLLQDRIVILGTGADSVKDQFLTPYNRGGGSDDPFMFGPTLHAHAVDQLLRLALEGRGMIVILDDIVELCWLALWVGLGLIVGRTPFEPVSFIWRTGLGGAGPVAAQLLFIHGHVWLPSATATAGFFLATILATALASQEERKQRQVLKSILDKSVSPAVAEEILVNRHNVIDAGRIRTQKLTATVLFTDLVNFTPLAEQMEPEALIVWLNEYMGAMGGRVLEHHGVVDKYIGDAIMALFGVPVARVSQEEMDLDAVNAVSCALRMGQALERELIPTWKSRGLPEISMRVGIHSGPLVAGGLGHQERMDYTVIGDTVNIAARLESLKPGADYAIRPSVCRILISEAVLTRLKGRFVTHPVGEMHLKGRSVKVAVHQVVDFVK